MRATIVGAGAEQQRSLSAALEHAGFTIAVGAWSGLDEALGGAVVADLRGESTRRMQDLQGWRARGLSGPLLVLCEPGGLHLQAIEHGADDYLIAPFEARQVAERLAALWHRQVRTGVTRIQLNDGHVELARRSIVRQSASWRLTATEARLLEFLARHANTSFSREQLQVQVWGYQPGVKSRTVFTTVERLRRKLERDPAEPVHLITDRGGRYRLAVNVTEAPVAASAPLRLPGDVTPFVGRAQEWEQLLAALQQPTTRLVTIVGAGGVGKTRLALEAARALGPQYRDGALVVKLAAAETSFEVGAAIADSLDVQPGSDLLNEVAEALRQRECLLVLDNFEQVLGFAAMLPELLAAAPGVTILCTSRLPLRLRAERLLPLAGLAPSDAAALFTSVAERSRVGWCAPDDAVIARIIDRLEHVPLTVILAAGWARRLSGQEIAAELERGLELLADGPLDLPERHRSLRAVFEGSWSILDDSQRRQLAALAIFRASFGREAAQAVAACTLADLLQLVEASLLRRHGEAYDLHPLVVELAREKLRDSSHAAEVAERHRNWVRGKFHGWALDLAGVARDDAEIMQEVEQTWPDSWWVWWRAAETADTATLLSALPVMMRVGHTSPRLAELMAPAIAGIEANCRPPYLPAQRAVLAAALAGRALGRGLTEWRRGLDDMQRAVALVDDSDDVVVVLARAGVLALHTVMLAYAMEGSSELFERSLQAQRTSEIRWLTVLETSKLLFSLAHEGNVSRFDELHRQSAALFDGPMRLHGQCRIWLGLALLHIERWQAAADALRDAIACLHRSLDRDVIAWAEIHLAIAHAELADPIARELVRDVLDDIVSLRLPRHLALVAASCVAWTWLQGIAPPKDAVQRAAAIAAAVLGDARVFPLGQLLAHKVAREARRQLGDAAAIDSASQAGPLLADDRWIERLRDELQLG